MIKNKRQKKDPPTNLIVTILALLVVVVMIFETQFSDTNRETEVLNNTGILHQKNLDNESLGPIHIENEVSGNAAFTRFNENSNDCHDGVPAETSLVVKYTDGTERIVFDSPSNECESLLNAEFSPLGNYIRYSVRILPSNESFTMIYDISEDEDLLVFGSILWSEDEKILVATSGPETFLGFKPSIDISDYEKPLEINDALTLVSNDEYDLGRYGSIEDIQIVNEKVLFNVYVALPENSGAKNLVESYEYNARTKELVEK